MTIGIIDTGCANLASVGFALDRLSVGHRLLAQPHDAAGCERLILPGVGSAGHAMARLTTKGWDSFLRDDTRPLLGICLGFQLLFEHSEESDTPCLGLLPGCVTRLTPPEGASWPHMGWNTLEPVRPDPLIEGLSPETYVYFVHGFKVDMSYLTLAACTYGDAFSAIVREGHLMGAQFHPERSSGAGRRLLSNFVTASFLD